MPDSAPTRGCTQTSLPPPQRALKWIFGTRVRRVPAMPLTVVDAPAPPMSDAPAHPPARSTSSQRPAPPPASVPPSATRSSPAPTPAAPPTPLPHPPATSSPTPAPPPPCPQSTQTAPNPDHAPSPSPPPAPPPHPPQPTPSQSKCLHPRVYLCKGYSTGPCKIRESYGGLEMTRATAGPAAPPHAWPAAHPRKM
jgi:hypothetical protein